jgi:hypothetical protein
MAFSEYMNTVHGSWSIKYNMVSKIYVKYMQIKLYIIVVDLSSHDCTWIEIWV